MQAYTKTSLSELCISHSPELCLLRETVVYTCYNMFNGPSFVYRKY